jgi:hypothetical protein
MFAHSRSTAILNSSVSPDPTRSTPALWNSADGELDPLCSLHCLDPLRDDRWDTFVAQHPRASVFHTSSWLEALHRTYGYEPVAYTTSAPTDALENAVVFCRVESWLTGRRLVSLPFSDHCEPLTDSQLDATVLARLISRELVQNEWRYLEIRPLASVALGNEVKGSKITYGFHELDLTQSMETIFSNFHKSSIQRKILRSQREGLGYCEGSSESLLDDFYGLFELTRRKHRLPPQPREWFENLTKCFGPELKIRVAYKNRQAVAAMITIHHRKKLVYKYGCSDARFNNLGSMHFLFWRAIQEAKAEGLDALDFGRTDADQQGLITFKNRWGAKQSVLTYLRYSVHTNATHFFDLASSDLKARVAKALMSYLPSRAVSGLGKVLYRHIG